MIRRLLIFPVFLTILLALGCDTTEPKLVTASSSNKSTEDGNETDDTNDTPKEIEEIKCEGAGVGEEGTAHRLQIAYGKRMGAANGGIEMDADGRIVAAIDGKIEMLNQAGVGENTIPLGGAVYDFDLDRASGTIAAVGAFGISLVESGNVRAIDNHTLNINPDARISIGADRTVAVLDKDGLVQVFAGDGSKRCEFTVGNHLEDVEAVAEEKLIIVCGFTQATRILQIPWMYAYTYEGNRKWINYNEKIEGLGADTRCNTLELAPDGLLYMSGEQSGGGSPFHKDPKDSSKSVNNASFDRYQNAYQLN